MGMRSGGFVSGSRFSACPLGSSQIATGGPVDGWGSMTGEPEPTHPANRPANRTMGLMAPIPPPVECHL